MKIQYMTRIMQILCLMSLVLMTPLFAEIERVPIEDRVYGIVRGENVPARILPDDKARINAKLKNYEFVAVTKIGEGKEEGWVKIYNIPGKEGWVKRDCIKVIDKKNAAFMEILNNHYYCRIGKMLNSSSATEEISLFRIEKVDDYYFISYRISDVGEPYFVIDYTRVYKYIDGELWEIIWNNMIDARIYLSDNRIFFYSKRQVRVYDAKSISDPESKYKNKRYQRNTTMIDEIHFNITKYLDSYMEFDPKTKIVTQYLRIKENQPYVIEKYQFKNDEFVQIGGRQHEM